MADRSLKLLLLTGALSLCVAGCPDDNDDDTSMDAGTTDLGDKDTGVEDTGADAGTDAGADAGTDAGADTGVDGGVGPQSMTFLHTNDEHSHAVGFPNNVDDYPTLSMDESIMGGVYRRAVVIQQLKQEAQANREPVAVVNGGDVSMGTLFGVANLAASPDYNVLSTLGYDVGTLGNHEFDFGVGSLATMISQGQVVPSMPNPTFDVLNVPLVVSNIRFSASSPDDDALAAFWSESGAQGQPIQRYHVETFEDVTVGFVGYMGIEAALVAPFKSPVTFSLAVDPQSSCTNNSECPLSICIPPADDPTAANGNCALDPSGADFATNFPALVADVAGAVAEVRAQGVDMVVAVSHAGVNERELAMLEAMGMGPENAVASEDILLALGVDQALSANNIPGIDVIVGGHSHTALQAPLEIPNPASGISTFIVQAGSKGSHVGKLRIERQSPDDPWTLDETYSGLVEVNGLVNTNGINFLTKVVLDGLFSGIVDFLESMQLAQPGDDLIFPGEQCDGTVLPNNGNCVPVVPGADGGMLACLPNRQLDLSGCTFPAAKTICGDDNTDLNEQCDGTDIPATCQDLGYSGGTLGCHPNCAYDFTNCTPYFPSLLEAALNFQLEQGEPEIRDDPATMGDLFFYVLGQAAFDVGETHPHNESNLANLVADSSRWAVNTLNPRAATDPVEIAIVANGVIRDGMYQGMTGDLTFADMFRVLPLGVSPQENTPGYSLTDFWLTAPEIKAGLEVSLSNGLNSDSFWLGISGARVEYDLSRPEFDPTDPMNTGRVTKIELIDTQAGDNPWADSTATYEQAPLFDLNQGGFSDPNRLIHVTTSIYITLFIEGFGICPRDNAGVQFAGCASCTMDDDCTRQGTVCDTTAGRCVGGPPAGFFFRTTAPRQSGFAQELKDVLGMNTYIRRMPNGGALPTAYSDPVPRRMCCVGAACPADGSRTCN